MKKSALPTRPISTLKWLAAFIIILAFLTACKNHRERLVSDFTGHDFQHLELANKIEGYDEYADAGYFASAYNISPADARALEKLLPDQADASFFARSEMVPFLRPGTYYRYKMDIDKKEVTAALLDSDDLRIIFYHSKAGR